MTSAATGLALLLRSASRAMTRRFEERTRDRDLTAAQWRLLVYLLGNGPQPQARLAEQLEIEPISVSRLLDRMEQGGWVRRVPDPGDRRVRVVEPTERATASLSKMRGMADEIYAEALEGISDDERAQMMGVLRRLTDNLTRDCDDRDAPTDRKDPR